MAEVPDHLVPTDGLTDSTIEFESLYSHRKSGTATVRFRMRNEDGNDTGSFDILVAPNENGSVDEMIAFAHRQMIDVLRQWIYELDILRAAREKSAAR